MYKIFKPQYLYIQIVYEPECKKDHRRKFRVRNFRVTDIQELFIHPHHTPLIIHHSSYTTVHTCTTHQTPLITDHTQLVIHHSSYTTHHTPLIIHHSSYTTHQTPLIIHHSSYTTHQTPLIIHHSSDTTHHTPLIIQLTLISRTLAPVSSSFKSSSSS